MLRFKVLSWEAFSDLAFRLWVKAYSDGFRPDLVVAILRGGYPIGLIVSNLYGVDVEALRIEHYHGRMRKKRAEIVQPLHAEVSGKQILLVDDVTDTGESLRLALNHLESRGASNVKTGTLHVKPGSRFIPNYYVEKTNAWIVYPWEIGDFIREFKEKMLREGKNMEEVFEALRRFGFKDDVLSMLLRV